MRGVPGFFEGELTLSPVIATLLSVEPEPDVLGTGYDEKWVATQVHRAQAGDSDGYRELFRLYVRRIHGLVRRLAGPGGDVDDLVQVAFAQAFRSLPSFRGESSFYTWLGRIAVRSTLRHARQSRVPTVPLDQAPDEVEGGLSPERSSDARRALARFDGILASLSEKRRAAFVLHVLQGHSLEEVSAMLDVSVAAVKVRVHDARIEIERLARLDPYLVHYLQWEPTP